MLRYRINCQKTVLFIKTALLGSLNLVGPFFYSLSPQISRAQASAPLQAFPAREILEAVQKGEILIRKSATLRPPAETSEEAEVLWDAWAEPEASRSWLYLSVPSRTLELMQANLDENAQPLFPDRVRLR